MLSDFLSLIYPSCCEACHTPLVKGEDLICTGCRMDLPLTNFHVEHESPLAIRFHGFAPIAYAVAYYKFTKSGRVQRLLHQLKYGNVPEIGSMLGKYYGFILSEAGYDKRSDVIIPVPLHSTRLRKRGYNQSAHFGYGLAASLNIPIEEHALQRIKKTSTQTKKGRLERMESLSGAFGNVKKEVVEGRRIMLVDDVITTGATLLACMEVLYQAGASEVGVAALAAGE
ncbi:ComF family protein [Roseivirga sp. BDSF3-8]|uniref:ComF family protein n=1 Tax=Roseivirga sp. BDSF3-8 TaxID=3241598 RepID=UPI00353189B4